jgi:glycosyltransferase involved in cell wall biosynthesis
MSNLPLSVILPHYNHGHVVSLALDAALAQSFSDFEIIIIDDGSIDGSLSILEDYKKKDTRIKLLKHAANRGIAETVKVGLQLAKGEFIYIISASDCCLPGFFEKSIKFLRDYPTIGLCCTDVGLFSDSPFEYTPYRLLPSAAHPLVFPPEKIIPILNYARFTPPGCSTIMKRKAFIKYGGYQKKLHFLQDTVLNYQVVLYEGACYLPETLVVVREPEYSKIASQTKEIRKEALHHFLCSLLEPQNKDVLIKMKKSGVLGILGKECIREIIQHPSLWSIYKELSIRYIFKKIKDGLKKDLVSARFLNQHSIFRNLAL